MDNYIEKMNLFKKMIRERNKEGLKALMEEANKIRKILH
jgi:prephenate dehydrogenase